MNIIKDTSIKKFGLATLTLIFAIVMLVIVTPFAIVYNIVYSIYNKTIRGFLKFWGWIFYQVWTVIYLLKFTIALCIDYFGNAFCGHLIKDFILINKELVNLFGNGSITLSAAIGQAIFNNNITKIGIFISNTLDKLFSEKNHCLNAYTKYLSVL